jgi:hypothetical protein
VAAAIGGMPTQRQRDGRWCALRREGVSRIHEPLVHPMGFGFLELQGRFAACRRSPTADADVWEQASRCGAVARAVLSDAVQIVVLPYLPLRDAVVIGGWRLIPARSPDDDAFVDADTRIKGEGLLRLYGAGADARVAGAFAAPPGGRIGDDPPVDQLATLRRTIVAGLLEGNPIPPALADNEATADPNGGWKSATSDNAAIWVHPIDEHGYTAVGYGVMVTMLSGGHNVLREDSVSISRPAELPMPFLYGSLDSEYSDAVFAVLGAADEQSRRLGRAIDWLDLAWRNTPSVTLEVRVVLLRTGFEVLFGNDNTYVVRDELGVLLDDEQVTRRERTWRTLAGNLQTAELSDLCWWFMQFAFLRNAIMHGDQVTASMFEHEGRPHLWLAESRLREAIKSLVVQTG